MLTSLFPRLFLLCFVFSLSYSFRLIITEFTRESVCTYKNPLLLLAKNINEVLKHIPGPGEEGIPAI